MYESDKKRSLDLEYFYVILELILGVAAVS